MERFWRELGGLGRAIFIVLALVAVGMVILRLVSRSKIPFANNLAGEGMHLVQGGTVS